MKGILLFILTSGFLLTGCRDSRRENNDTLANPDTDQYALPKRSSSIYSGIIIVGGKLSDQKTAFLFEQQGVGAMIREKRFWNTIFTTDFRWQRSGDSLYMAGGIIGEKTLEPQGYLVQEFGDSLILTHARYQYRLKKASFEILPKSWVAPRPGKLENFLSSGSFVSIADKDFLNETTFSEDVISGLLSTAPQVTRVIFSFDPSGSGYMRKSWAASVDVEYRIPSISIDPITWNVVGDSLIYHDVQRLTADSSVTYNRHAAAIHVVGDTLYLASRLSQGMNIRKLKKIHFEKQR
ncbi:hypothetical protein LZD49_33785 [Dyadobacter sp. CY261]|uniref:hypothetical protein n=1 Tax=Dyadobacter sp. CY261 TaxID=2907203 RepID=UPI001F1E38F3|nr:hypothetical protein [Dyadobacter sp. CY261]MCF0075498.1 hypothetical protein [Dyadobacter sp. CY261]